MNCPECSGLGWYERPDGNGIKRVCTTCGGTGRFLEDPLEDTLPGVPVPQRYLVEGEVRRKVTGRGWQAPELLEYPTEMVPVDEYSIDSVPHIIYYDRGQLFAQKKGK